MFNETDIDRLRGATAYDRNGEKIGNVGEVYLDDQTGQPMWITVNTGFFGMNTSFVPLEGSTFEADDRLVVAHDKDVVKDAPNLEENGHLDRAAEDDLYSYYGVGGGALAGDAMRTRRWEDDRDLRDGDLRDGRVGDDRSMFDRDGDGRGPVGEVLDGPDGTRSDRRGDVGLDPHADRGYAADAGNYDSRDGVRDDRSMFDRDGDGRGPVGEVLDGPDGQRGYDDRRNGPLLDSDRDGRGPIEEVLDGPDDPNHPRRI